MPNQGSYDLRHDVDRLQRKVNVFEDGFADSFFIETSVPTIIYKDDIFNPKSITFYSYKNNKGKIEIEYYSQDDFERIVDILKK